MPLKIKKIYTDNLLSKSYEIAFLVVIFRFISPPFVYLLSELKVNPLHISYANLFIVLTALSSFIFSSNIILPILLLALWQFVDTLDGGVARTRNMISNYGGFIDQLSGMIMLAFFPRSGSIEIPHDHSMELNVGNYPHGIWTAEEPLPTVSLGTMYYRPDPSDPMADSQLYAALLGLRLKAEDAPGPPSQEVNMVWPQGGWYRSLD